MIGKLHVNRHTAKLKEVLVSEVYADRGTWVAQSVKHPKCPTPGFDSGHDLTVHGFEPCVRLCTDGVEPVWDFPSPSLSAPPLLSLSQK